ncbi:MAG: IS5 family transposase [Bryobacteraceae bacterium]
MEKRRSYPTDVTDEQWSRLEPLIPAPKPGGRPPSYGRREIVDAVLDQLRGGAAWRMMPHDLPPWGFTCHYWRAWRKDGTWERAHDTLRTEVRQAMGKQAQPSAGIVDSQSVKTTDRGGVHGYDAGKKINGRKRHLSVDTLGLVWLVAVTAAGTQDRDGARTLLAALATGMRRLRVIWADGGYAGALAGWVASLRKWGKVRLELVARNREGQGFQRLPHRWIVERTFGWLHRGRRLSKDYEHLTATSECTIRVDMICLMVRRLAPPKKRRRERRSRRRRLF